MQALLLVGFSVFAGLSCDAPAVEDGRTFESSCDIAPLGGASMSFSGPWRLRLEAEGAYSRRAFRSEAFVSDEAVRADFLELGFLGAWPLRSAESALGITAIGGPQVGVRLRALRRFRDLDQDVTDELRAADLRLVGGLRLSHRVGRGSFFVEGRFALGLTDLDDTNQQEIRSRAFGVQLGYAR